MKISVFTPTHNPEHLLRLAKSLDDQTFTDFEWVIVANGKVTSDDISEIGFPVLVNKVQIFTSEATNIGALKKFACSLCKGEILVEVDHDDELFPTALEEIAAAFEDKKIDFVYTNCCRVNEDGTGNVFSKEFGWEHKVVTNDRLEGIHLETVAFAPSPAAFSKIWYAPDHARAWRRSFYQMIGGHDETLDILDDHDLLCRTYINGRVHHIDKPLYIYHLHPNNTCYGEKNDRIQAETLLLHDKYIFELVEKWCDVKGLRKIDLCGGHNPPPGYESVDLKNGTITADLNSTEWPFKDGEVGVFRAHDALEHLHNPINTMKEIYRCLAVDGWLLSLTPSTDGRGAFQDPTHVSFWNSNSFWYYTRKAQNNYIDCPVRFQLNRIVNEYPSEWHKFHEIMYVKAHLVKLGAERVPGTVEI